MDARERRIEEDIDRIKKLKADYPVLIQTIAVKGNPVSVIRLTLTLPTAADRDYPRKIQREPVIQIELSARYPLTEPRVSVLSPVWNPNVYLSGLVCLGHRWLPTEGLDLLVIRVMRLLAFDPLLINTGSPANPEASRWYLDARGKNAAYFPSTKLDNLIKVTGSPSMQWRNVH